MKKVFAVMMVATVMSTVAFAQEEGAKKPSWLSVGVGGFIGSDFSGGGAELINRSSSGGLAGEKQIFPYFGGGGFLFVDVKYAELTLGFFGGSGASKSTVESSSGTRESERDLSYASFNVALLLK